MSERNVQSNPPPDDFDPAMLTSRNGRDLNKLPTVQVTMPYSMRCRKCRGRIAHGKKFNAKKENTREYFYKTEILRFYIRCPNCNSQVNFKTGPKYRHCDADEGERRRQEPWTSKILQETDDEVPEEGELDVMKKLEVKRKSSMNGTASMDSLDAMWANNEWIHKLRPVLHPVEIMRWVAGVKISETKKQDDRKDEDLARPPFRIRHPHRKLPVKYHVHVPTKKEALEVEEAYKPRAARDHLQEE